MTNMTVRELFDAGMKRGVTLTPQTWIRMPVNEGDNFCACAVGVLMLGIAPQEIDSDYSPMGLYDEVSEAFGLSDNNWSFDPNRLKDAELVSYKGYATLESAFDQGVCRGEFTLDQLIDMAQARVDEELAKLKETPSE